MGTKKFMKNYGWGCIGRMMVQLIPILLFILYYSLVLGGFHEVVFHKQEHNITFGQVLAIIVYLYIPGALIVGWFRGEIGESFGWWVKPFGEVNKELGNIDKMKGKSRARKAKRIYAYCCLFKYILVFALFLPDIESHVVDSLVLTLFFFVYYLIVDIVIGIMSARNTCPVCGSSAINTNWGKTWSSTKKFVEHNDERIGTVSIGETKVGIYQNKPSEYKTTTEYKSGYRVCSVCGHKMGDVKHKSSYTISTEYENYIREKAYKNIQERLDKIKEE